MKESSRQRPTKGKVRRKLVRQSSISNETQLEISGVLANYSVALGRVQGEDPNTFQLIGSGVCVIRNRVRGILTGHHCLHAVEPEVALGKVSNENLVFMVKRGGIIRTRAAYLVEHELAPPKEKGGYGPNGPDLTFIEIPPGPALESFIAAASFFNLDREFGGRATEALPRAIRSSASLDFRKLATT